MFAMCYVEHESVEGKINETSDVKSREINLETKNRLSLISLPNKSEERYKTSPLNFHSPRQLKTARLLIKTR